MFRGRAALAVALLLAALAQPPAARAQQAGGIGFGLAHVDLMELHLERQPDAGPIVRELLPAAEIERRYRLAAGTGIRWHRWSLYRELIETAEGYDWSVTDGIVERDARAGFGTLALLQGSPEGMSEPIFLDGSGGWTDDPGRAAGVNPANGWARFVDAAVERYRPGSEHARARSWPPGSGARAWEIGNEPNLTHFWQGSPADYARFLEVAYLVIERRDPSAIVLHGGIGDDGNAERWYADFLAALQDMARRSPLPERHGYYFDRAAWHWYRSPSLLMTGPARARALLAEAGLPPKPIWVTETGLPVWSEYPGPCWDPGSPGRATVVEQADFVWQTLAEAAASEVELLVLFQLVDDCGNGPRSYDAFGLVRNPAEVACWQAPGDHACWAPDPERAGQPRPAYEAFRVAVRELTGASLRRQSAAGGAGWRQLEFDRQPDARVRLAWATGSADVDLELPAYGRQAEVLAIEADGRVSSRPIAAAAERYRLRLPGAGNRNPIGGRAILHGRPVLLVERGINLARPGTGDYKGEDLEPPLLAAVEPLPERSPPRLQLAIAAADRGSGLAAWMLFVASGPAPPRSPEAWRPLGGMGAWTAEPAGGRVQVPFEGRAGQRYYFAAQAADQAGNWSALPAYAQATTLIVAPGRRGTGGRASGHLPH